MNDNLDEHDNWPSAKQYGQRFAALDKRLARGFLLAEYRGASEQEIAVLRYRLAKLYIAAEDIQAAIGILVEEASGDTVKSEAVVELRNACGEVIDSFGEVNDSLVRLLNFLS